ncbi:MAG: Gldg family protein [Flavobacteriales bacterium]|nr:Gldg family protein [Flavobacteriales bacterium]
MRTKARAMRTLLLVGAAVVLVNLVGTLFHLRLDLTGDKRYTLSPATRELLASLPEAATVTAYFTEELPPDLAVVREDLKDLLVEYAARSNGNVLFEFIDPGKADSIARQAEEEGVQWVLVNTREKDKASQIKAYMGAVVRMGERTTPIRFLQPGSALEWELSSALKQVSNTEPPAIGLIQGHGEPALSTMPQLDQAMGVLYALQPMALFDTVPVHQRFSALLWIEPKDSIPEAHFRQLEAYLARGGRLLVAASRSMSDLTTSPLVDVRRPELFRWLEKRGVHVEPGVVVDANCGQIQVMQQRGMFTVQVPMGFPYFPLVSSFGKHAVTSGIEAVLFQFVSPMVYQGDTANTSATPLLRSSIRSGVVALPQTVDLQRQWTDLDFLLGEQVLGLALEDQATGRPLSRMVVLGNGSFLLNGSGQQLQQVNPGNINLVVNAVDWLTDSTGLIELRNKGVGFRPLKETDDATRTAIKWAMLLVPVLAVLAHGLFRSRWRKRQRQQRMQPDHVR